MKIEDVTVSATYELRDRNRSIGIDCPPGQEITLHCARRVTLIDPATGQEVYVPAYPAKEYSFSTRLALVADRIVTLPAEYGGASISVAALAAFIEVLTNTLAYEFTHANQPAEPEIPVEPESSSSAAE